MHHTSPRRRTPEAALFARRERGRTLHERPRGYRHRASGSLHGAARDTLDARGLPRAGHVWIMAEVGFEHAPLGTEVQCRAGDLVPAPGVLLKRDGSVFFPGAGGEGDGSGGGGRG